jgi:hypothetical protein
LLDFVIVSTGIASSGEAGRDLADLVQAHNGTAPDAVILFASPSFEPELLLREFVAGARPKQLVGCTSAGEFTQAVQGTGLACCVAMWSSELTFQASVGHGICSDHMEAARQLADQLTAQVAPPDYFRTGILFVDALAGHTEPFLDQLTVATAGAYQFVGGGAGDDGQFLKTSVFMGSEVFEDAAVVLGIVSRAPLAVGVGHGWSPRSDRMRVTESAGNVLYSLNGVPAQEATQAYAAATNQELSLEQPLPFFLHNILGMETPAGYKLRVPLGVQEDGSLLMAANVPVGSVVSFMSTSAKSAAAAARNAAASGMGQLADAEPRFALFFDCVATRLGMGEVEFGNELKALSEAMHGVPFMGFNTHGQVARASGQFSGFHNCTAVVCMFP